jgi:predicted small lipoprotein YifL
MKRLLLPLVALLVLSASLTACGQKGPLYHPEDEKAAKQHDKDVYEL